MTLRFFYFKSSEPQNFKGQLRFSWSFFKIGRIPYSMLGVQCSMFIFLAFFRKKQLSAYGVYPRPYWVSVNRIHSDAFMLSGESGIGITAGLKSGRFNRKSNFVDS
jgi:hypothetical protein